jgi:archaellin
MVNPSTLLSAATFALSAKDRAERKELEEKMQNGDSVPQEADPELKVAEETNRKLDRLVEQQEVTEPSPEDKDAYASSTFELNSNETAVITVEPAEGFNLRVKEVYLDRKVDHEYRIVVGSEVNSVSHRAKYAKPKLVSQSDKVVAEVTNLSGSTTVIDFELQAWAEQGAT